MQLTPRSSICTKVAVWRCGSVVCRIKAAFYDADTDILADILTRIVTRMSACRASIISIAVSLGSPT